MVNQLNEFRTLYRYLQENSKLEINNKCRIRWRKEKEFYRYLQNNLLLIQSNLILNSNEQKYHCTLYVITSFT